MKAIIVSLITLCVNMMIYAQIDHFILDFEDQLTIQQHLTIDSISNPDNSWQIGKPNKQLFAEAYSLPNAILTDTVNSYPPNDSSVFIITHYADYGFVTNDRATLDGWYRVDCDSLNDFGRIEFSPDNGKLWIDLINDSIDPPPMWGGEKPILTGRSDWTQFWVNLAQMGFEYELGDTVLFRFTFISDEIDNHRDGLMFDHIAFNDFTEGIEHSRVNDFYSKIYPNPDDQRVTIEFENSNLYPVLLSIFDNSGRLILSEPGGEQGYFRVDVSTFPSGNYFYRLFDNKSNRVSHGKIIVN